MMVMWLLAALLFSAGVTVMQGQQPAATSPAPVTRGPVAQQVDPLPFQFYGKVVDEKGQPVQGATVTFTVTGRNAKGDMSAGESKATSDEHGRMALSGTAYAINAKVAHPGYHTRPESDFYGTIIHPKGLKGKAFPPITDPQIFRLVKKLELEPMEHVRHSVSPREVSPNGYRINMLTGRQHAYAESAIVLNIHNSTEDADSQGRCSWYYSIEFEGAECLPREDRLAFMAPAANYKLARTEGTVPPYGKDWTNWKAHHFFAKLPDGRYMRGVIQVHGGSSRSPGGWYFEAYINATPGSRNLEWEDQKPPSHSGVALPDVVEKQSGTLRPSSTSPASGPSAGGPTS